MRRLAVSQIACRLAGLCALVVLLDLCLLAGTTFGQQILRFEAEDQTYNCEPHALDYPVDNLEKLESADLENALREGAVAVAEVAALAHEKSVIDAALTAAGAGDDKNWGSTADPVADVDAAILNVIKAAKYGSLMGVGVLFGASAWVAFKNNAAVRGRFVVGNGAKGASLAVPTEPAAGHLFVGTPEVRASYMVYDSAAVGVAENVRFLLDTTVLVFARRSSPTRPPSSASRSRSPCWCWCCA